MLRIRPRHTRWLAACLLMLLLSVWAGGFSFSAVMVFATIFAAGAALLSSGFPAPLVPDWTSAEEDEDDGPAEDGDADADSPDDSAEDSQPVSEDQAERRPTPRLTSISRSDSLNPPQMP